MKNTIYLLPVLFTMFCTSVSADTLTINLSGASLNQGKIRIGVFNSPQEFPNGNLFVGRVIDSDKKDTKIVFDIPPGSYAVGVFQDKSGNKLLDKNFLGIPKEKYGFSGRDVFGEPDFDDAIISFAGSKTIFIKIK